MSNLVVLVPAEDQVEVKNESKEDDESNEVEEVIDDRSNKEIGVEKVKQN